MSQIIPPVDFLCQIPAESMIVYENKAKETLIGNRNQIMVGSNSKVAY